MFVRKMLLKYLFVLQKLHNDKINDWWLHILFTEILMFNTSLFTLIKI